MFKCCVPFELIWFQRACACACQSHSKLSDSKTGAHASRWEPWKRGNLFNWQTAKNTRKPLQL